MSIKITAKGLEISDPTFDELSKFNALENAMKAAERERIIAIVDEFIENSDYPEVVSSLQWLQSVIKGENK